MTTTYPSKKLVVEVLAEAASHAAHESGAEHPQDIQFAMQSALEGAAATVEILWKRGILQ